MKRIIVILILVMTTIGCTLFDMESWERIEREDKERGRTCYRNEYGNYSCRDKYGNRIN